ncbi:hypothetical protein Dimus_008393, partial [Dionaea muscipula]
MNRAGNQPWKGQNRACKDESGGRVVKTGRDRGAGGSVPGVTTEPALPGAPPSQLPSHEHWVRQGAARQQYRRDNRPPTPARSRRSRRREAGRCSARRPPACTMVTGDRACSGGGRAATGGQAVVTRRALGFS